MIFKLNSLSYLVIVYLPGKNLTAAHAKINVDP